MAGLKRQVGVASSSSPSEPIVGSLQGDYIDFEVLASALRVAWRRQIKTVKELRLALGKVFPGQWARTNGGHAVTRYKHYLVPVVAMNRATVLLSCALVLLLTACAEKGPSLRQCNYEADLATASLATDLDREARRDDLVRECMALKGFYPKAQVGLPYVVIRRQDPSAWSDQPQSSERRPEKGKPTDWKFPASAIGVLVWSALIVYAEKVLYEHALRRFPLFENLINGRPPWNQASRLLVRLLAVALLAVAAVAFYCAVLFLGFEVAVFFFPTIV